MKSNSLDHLLPKAREGDKKGMDTLAKELDSYLKTVFIPEYDFQGYGKKDLIQDTILIVLKNIQKIKSGLKTYAYKVLRNLVGDNLRKKYGRKAWEEAQQRPILNKYGRVEETDLAPIMTELVFDPGHSTFEVVKESGNIEIIYGKIGKLKDFCKLYVKAIVANCVDKLYEVYQSLNPDNAKATYYVDLNRCRKSIRAIISREDLI